MTRKNPTKYPKLLHSLALTLAITVLFQQGVNCKFKKNTSTPEYKDHLSYQIYGKFEGLLVSNMVNMDDILPNVAKMNLDPGVKINHKFKYAIEPQLMIMNVAYKNNELEFVVNAEENFEHTHYVRVAYLNPLVKEEDEISCKIGHLVSLTADRKPFFDTKETKLLFVNDYTTGDKEFDEKALQKLTSVNCKSVMTKYSPSLDKIVGISIDSVKSNLVCTGLAKCNSVQLKFKPEDGNDWTYANHRLEFGDNEAIVYTPFFPFFDYHEE
jgi:hypothetical protein